jgi:hypothetical protein
MWYAATAPAFCLSVEHCKSLGSFGACNDSATCMIVAIHMYHMLAFSLNQDDIFHHLVFVPIIGGIHFVCSWGTAGNILTFFISGFPGGLSYFLLAAVKAGTLPSLTEKRWNCSINTWIRSPGITIFCTLVAAARTESGIRLAGVPASEVAPWYLFWPAVGLSFFNGQFYAQRVIGNYYIRKEQDCSKKGIKTTLHSS